MNGSNTEEGTAQMDEDGAARERDSKTGCHGALCGYPETCNGLLSFELIGPNR